MGNRLSYSNYPQCIKNDERILEFCQSLILLCLPNFKEIHIKEVDSKKYFYEALTEEQIKTAFENPEMDYKYYLELLQRCDIAYNEPSILELISSLIKNKNFFEINNKSHIKRILSKKIIDGALFKHLNKVIPKELKFLIREPYFIKYISELFLPLEKNRILITIEKFFELSLFDKNSLTFNFECDPQVYEIIKSRINRFRVRYNPVLQKYRNDPQYQTIEKIQSIQMAIDTQKERNREKKKKDGGDDFTLEKTFDNLDW